MFVDHGLLRKGEAKQVEQDFVAATGVDLVVVDAQADFAAALSGVTDPEEKRKIIGREFIRTFEQAASQIAAADARVSGTGTAEFLVQGTLYPDVVESGGGTGTANIKSHHNVGGLPEDLGFTLIEPLRTLFKDEVRALGAELGLPPEIVWRQPFPGPGLAIRIVGEVTPERLGSSGMPTRSPAPSSPRRDWTGRSGSAPSCCWPTCAPSASRVTSAATATRSCSGP